MDIQTLLNNLHEQVSCSVCMTTFTEPKTLPCLHSFCLHCLERILQTSGRHDIITCPECGIESRVPTSGNLSHLPTNFRINSLLDVLAIKECSTTGVKCGNCDKKSVQSLYCFQCSSFWCDNCITAHNIIRTNKQHRVLALKKFKDQDFEEVLKRPAFCGTPGHERKELEFFCKTCKVSICNACALTDHEGHAKMLLGKAGNERKIQVQSVIETHRTKAQQKRNKITELGKNCIHIEARAASVKQNVQEFVDFLMAVIEAKKREILNEVDIQVKESVERLRTQQCEVDSQVKLIETRIEKTETILKRSTSAEIVHIDESSLNAIFQEKASYEGEQVDSDLESLRRFVYVENETLIEKVVAEGIGSFKTFLSKACAQESRAEGKGISEATVGLEAELVLTTRNDEGEQCYEESDSVTVQIRNQHGYDCATETRVQDYKDGTYKISYFAKETGECDISLKLNSEHACGSPFAVQVKPRQFRPVFSFGQQGSAVGMLDGLWGVAVNERNDIAVTETENQRVSVFSSDGTHLRSFGSEGDKPGEFNDPAGIAFNKNGNIIVADSRNHRVQVFSEQGEYLNQFGEQGSLDHQLQCPYGLFVDENGNVIVADAGDKLIKIFSPSGRFLSKIGGDDSFTFPYHCVEYEKYLIVSDRGDDCIKVFDTNGQFLYKFGKKREGD
ncbi:E3 ubiquitin-protein ligase TRIM71-like [Oculina patagonica]